MRLGAGNKAPNVFWSTDWFSLQFPSIYLYTLMGEFDIRSRVTWSLLSCTPQTNRGRIIRSKVYWRNVFFFCSFMDHNIIKLRCIKCKTKKEAWYPVILINMTGLVSTGFIVHELLGTHQVTLSTNWSKYWPIFERHVYQHSTDNQLTVHHSIILGVSPRVKGPVTT